jgi:hypothetical protein
MFFDGMRKNWSVVEAPRPGAAVTTSAAATTARTAGSPTTLLRMRLFYRIGPAASTASPASANVAAFSRNMRASSRALRS